MASDAASEDVYQPGNPRRSKVHFLGQESPPFLASFPELIKPPLREIRFPGEVGNPGGFVGIKLDTIFRGYHRNVGVIRGEVKASRAGGANSFRQVSRLQPGEIFHRFGFFGYTATNRRDENEVLPMADLALQKLIKPAQFTGLYERRNRSIELRFPGHLRKQIRGVLRHHRR